MPPIPPAPTDLLPADDLLRAVLDVSLTGFIFFRPVYAPADPADLIDLAYVHLNPAAQRMLSLPECPAESFLTRYPNASETGIFAFYRATFLNGETAGRYEVNYQHDGLDNYFQLAGRRCGELLLVSFSDTADQPRTAVEVALRQSQAAEQEARTEAERQRQRFYEVLMRLPAYVAVYHGPDHIYQFVNPLYQRLFPHRSFAGRPFREAMPEANGLGVVALFDRVYQTGEPFYGHEMEGDFDTHDTGEPEHLFFNLYLLPLRNAQGEVDGIIDFSYDVSGQVPARRQLEQLNQELEARVQARTREADQQRARLESVFRQAPAAIAVYGGPDLVFELVNPVYQQLLPGRRLLGQPMREAFPEVAELPLYDTLQQVYVTGATHYEQDQLIPVVGPAGGDPQNRYFTFTLQARYDEHDHVDGVIGFGFETTAQVVARQQAAALQAELLAATQRQAREREEFYQIFEQAPAAVALLREPGHRFEYANPTLRSFFGGRDLRGSRFADVAPELMEQGFIALLDRVYQTGELYFGSEARATITQPDGSVRAGYFNFTYQAYRESGAIVGISIFAFDVTEQVLARQAREAQQALLSQVFAQAPVAICVFAGPDYVLDIVNPQMADMLGRPVAKLLSRPFFEALPELREQGLPELLDGVRRTGQPFVAQERAVRLERHAPGEVGYFNFVYEPLRDEYGALLAIVCVAIEVTEQVLARERVGRANAALSLTNEQLTRTNADLDNFIYAASHDLRAPISNLEGLLLALAEDLPPVARQTGAVQPVLDMMQAAIGRFQLTISELTDITRLQQANAQPAEAVDLAALTEAVRLDLEPLLLAAGASLTMDVADAPTVLLAPKNLRSILFNLLSNAIKYRHPARPPVVSLRAHRAAASGILLEVQDNGLGLDPSQQARLFGMFERLHDHVEGSGIGLYMVKRIVENAGGRIRVESEPGVGSKFVVELP